MGGKAFAELGQDAFPRIPTQIYIPLKERLAAQLKKLYAYVDTPAGSPEKGDHGDIVFVVCTPLTTNANDTDAALSDALARVNGALGAQYEVLAQGTRMSNFAVPAGPELAGKFCQVDLHVCKDKAEWQRTLFFNSYGDMGMILSLFARAHGLTLGTKGLRVSSRYVKQDESHISSFFLSDNLDEILPFLGLSMETWARGFATREDVFTWLKSSRFFIPRRLVGADPTQEKKAVRQHREMYQAFQEFSNALAAEQSKSDSGPKSESAEELVKEAIRQEALVYFGKKSSYDALVAENLQERNFRQKFNGTKMMEWTGLQGKVIRLVMHSVRERLSEVEIAAMDEKALRNVVLEVKPEAEVKYAAVKGSK